MQRVLLTDDEHNLRRLLSTVLKAAGLDVIEAANGHEALALAAVHEIDVLVTDVIMDEMDGFLLADCLVRKNAQLLVVLMSGYALDIEAAGPRYPHCALLTKPFPPKALVNAIRELTEKRAGAQ